jgi:hypothetical protein
MKNKEEKHSKRNFEVCIVAIAMKMSITFPPFFHTHPTTLTEHSFVAFYFICVKINAMKLCHNTIFFCLM